MSLCLFLLVDRVAARDRVVFLKLELVLDRLSVLGRVVGMTLTDALGVAHGDQFDEFVL